MYYFRVKRVCEELLDRVRGTAPAAVTLAPRPPMTPAPPPGSRL